MSNMHDWAKRFSRAVTDRAVDVCFDEWIQSVEERFAYPKIAKGGQEQVPNEPGLYLWGANRTVDGLMQIVPRYVGRARLSLTLQRRFVSRTGRWGGPAGRYVLGPGVSAGDTPPQGMLACLYHNQIRNAVGSVSNYEYANTLKPLHSPQSPAIRGLSAFPPAMVASFTSKERGHPGSHLRLRHAVDWALHGGPNLEHLWAAFLPETAHLEAKLRDAAIRWRRTHDLPPLLNVQDK